MEKLIDVQNIDKFYKENHVLKDISFHLNKGDVLGFLGPNGAGKTTTMKILTGYLDASAGKVSVAGFDVVTNPLQVKENIGYVPEGSPLYEDMCVIDFLIFCANARQIEESKIKPSIKNALDKLGLHPVKNKRIEELSKGFKRRVGIAQAILHDPKVLILDEPTDGLDPNQKQEIRNLINEIKKDKAIIISTHILDEVEAVCNRMIILDEGKIKLDSTPIEVLTQNQKSIHIEFMVAKESQQAVTSILSSHKQIETKIIADNNSSLTLSVQNYNSLEEVHTLLKELETKQINIINFTINKINLDDIFAQLTQTKEKTAQ